MYKSYNYAFEQRVKSILEVTNCCLGDVSVVVSDCFQSSNIWDKISGLDIKNLA